METIHTIETPEMTVKVNKTEIDIIHFIESWLPTFTSWSVKELTYKCRLSADDATAAIEMLMLHGLLDHAPDDSLMGRTIRVTTDGALWMRENRETINSLYMMNDTELFSEAETAYA
jgi:hypothetical protein|tara:strand:+ start:851 stop:1201 length:351 start_codon:yes stop_codon:yes gene_type:complete